MIHEATRSDTKAEEEKRVADCEMDGLTQREVDVLRCLVQGLTNAEAGQVLGISTRTVQGHCEEIYSKLGVRNRIEAVVLGLDVCLSLVDAKAAVERRRGG